MPDSSVRVDLRIEDRITGRLWIAPLGTPPPHSLTRVERRTRRRRLARMLREQRRGRQFWTGRGWTSLGYTTDGTA